jgi:hypothetical protein
MRPVNLAKRPRLGHCMERISLGHTKVRAMFRELPSGVMGRPGFQTTMGLWMRKTGPFMIRDVCRGRIGAAGRMSELWDNPGAGPEAAQFDEQNNLHLSDAP